jgi:hypothetical protein
MTFEGMLEEAGSGKASKEERRAKMARERLIDQVFGNDKEKEKTSGFADPALMF